MRHLPEKARLADARLPDHSDYVTAAQTSLVERISELLKFFAPADKARAHDDLAGIESNTDLHAEAIAPAHFLGIALHRQLHAERGEACTQRVVLVGDGGAEERHNAVASHFVHRPSKWWTASIFRSTTASSSLRASSGSRSASRSMEPLMSANSTVTCLRSPSRAALEVRIFSARCLGV